MSPTPSHSSRLADSNKTLADSIRPLGAKLPQPLLCFLGGVPTDFSLVTTIDGPQPRAIYYSIHLMRRIQIRPLRTSAVACLVRYPAFSSTESYRDAPSTSHAVSDSSCPAETNVTLADSIRPLALELPQPSVSFPDVSITDLFLLPAPCTASSPISVYHHPVNSPFL